MKIMKKIIAATLSVSTVCSMLVPMSALAAKKLTIADWTLNTGANSEIALDGEINYSGNYALKMTSVSSASAYTSVEVKQGHSYTLKFYTKGTRVNAASVTIGGSGYSLRPVASTFDWTQFSFDYAHTGADGKINITFAVSGNVSGFWVDGVSFTDNADSTGANLVTNPGFEERIASNDIVGINGESLEEKYYNLKKADRFMVSDLEQVLGGFKNIPVKPAKNIVIDGKGDDWADYSAIAVPTLSSQYKIFMTDDPNPRDMTADLKLAHDDEKFYMYLEVTDDIHTFDDSSNYWQKDSVQIALSRATDGYGCEIGFLYNADEDKGSIYSTAIVQGEIESIDYVARRDGNKTIYEIGIPWTIYYGGSPSSEMLLGFLINENNGTGRRYGLELAPDGISVNKSNEDFPFLNLITDDKDWYGWIEGEMKPFTDEENEYDLYLVNYGGEREFALTLPDGTVENITVGEGEGIRYEYNAYFEESGERIMSVGVDDSSVDYKLYVMPSVKKVEEYTKLFNKKLKETESLMKKCDKQGISYDDELAYYMVVQRFIEYMADDVSHNDFSRIDYTIEELCELCELSISNLNAYLSGEKQSVKVPKYQVTGEDKIDGQDIIAQTDEGERPVYFIGWGHFQPAANDMHNYPAFGFNTIQLEVGPSTVLRPRGNAKGWYWETNGGAQASHEISTSVAASGSQSLHVTNKTAAAPNVFASLMQEVEVEPNTTYEYGFKMKAKQAQGFWYGFNGYTDRNFILDTDTSDWTEFKATFTSGEDQTSTFFRFSIDGITEECYFDDVYARKVGTDENLIVNGDFEAEVDNKNWTASSWYLSELKGYLQKAEDSNQAMTLLISPHYLTDGVLAKNPEMKGGSMHTSPGYNVNQETAREYVEDYLRTLLPQIKDYKSIQSICMANEPHFAAAGMQDYYQPLWREFLENKYGTIERLNEAWDESYAKFDDVLMPATQSYNMQFYDYIQFNDDQFISWYKFMKDIIREYTDKPVHVKIMNTLGEQDHQGIDRRYKMFFGMNPERYAEICEMSGNDTILYPNWVKSGSEGPLEKSFVYDYQTSLRNSPVVNSEDHIINDQDSNYTDTEFYEAFVATDLWQGAVHGRTVSNIWTWQRAGGDASSIFNGLFLYRPDCVATASKVTNDLNRWAYQISAIRNEKRDVAVLYSISSRVYEADNMNAVYKAYESLNYNGKHALIVNEETISQINNCDALIIPHSVHVKQSAADVICNFIKNGGKVMIIGEDSLTYTEETNTELDKSVRDYIFANSTVIPCEADGNFMTSPTSEELQKATENFLADNKLQYVRLVDAETGETARNVEWMQGIYDGKLYVNVCNYEIDTPKTVYLEVAGNVCENVKELRYGDVFEMEFTIEPYASRVFEIEVDNVFVDTYNHWGETEINSLYKKGLVSGVSDSRFAPNSNISRAEFLALCLRTIKVEESEYQNSFKDVTADDWFAKVVETAKKCGFTAELEEDGNLLPNKAITREEMMTVLVKTYEYSGRTADGDASEKFTDESSIGAEFKNYVQKAVSMGWVKGTDGKILPKDTSTRAEAAALLNRYTN